MKTLFDKIWDQHVVKSVDAEHDILYIDHHFIHEVTSPQAFEALDQKGITVFRPEQTTATADHNVPTQNQHLEIKNELSRKQVERLHENCDNHNVKLYGLGNVNNGIVHVIGPELGITQPGMTIVCGDSHTSTHGAFGVVAFGIGTSQVAQVLASQCVLTSRPKTMLIKIEGILKQHVTAKDLILHIIKELGTDVGTGHFIEYAGSTIENLSMEERMTICNMSIEMGARGGLIAPDETTLDYLKERPQPSYSFDYDLKSDAEECFDQVYHFNAEEIECTITYGTNPGMGIGISDELPKEESKTGEKALQYMGLETETTMEGLPIQNVFIGSCTNGRFEDFRAASKYIRNRRIAPGVKAYIVPGSNKVLQQLKDSGVSLIFEEAGFEIRQPGCSACLAMNGDSIPEGEYCVSTSNRNFEGRQGNGARTILASPIVAAIAAVEGKITDPNKF